MEQPRLSLSKQNYKEITEDFIKVTLGFTLLTPSKGILNHLFVKRFLYKFSVSSLLGDFALQSEGEFLIWTRDSREARGRRHVSLFKTIIARFRSLHFDLKFTVCVRVTNSFLQG